MHLSYLWKDRVDGLGTLSRKECDCPIGENHMSSEGKNTNEDLDRLGRSRSKITKEDLDRLGTSMFEI